MRDVLTRPRTGSTKRQRRIHKSAAAVQPGSCVPEWETILVDGQNLQRVLARCQSSELAVDQLLPFIEERWGIEPPKIAMLGVSMGGQGALQLSFRHAAQFPVVAAISPAVDFHQLYGQNLPLTKCYCVFRRAV